MEYDVCLIVVVFEKDSFCCIVFVGVFVMSNYSLIIGCIVKFFNFFLS